MSVPDGQVESIEMLDEIPLEAVRMTVEKFWSHLASHVPPPEFILLTDKATMSHGEWLRYRQKTRCYEGVGVYLHLSTSGELLYLGMTVAGFDRCWANDCPDRRWIVGVRVSPEYAFLVPSLEYFLLLNLESRNNVMHNSRRTSSV